MTNNYDKVRDGVSRAVGDVLRSQEPFAYPWLVAGAAIKEVREQLESLFDATPDHPNNGLRQKVLALLTPEHLS